MRKFILLVNILFLSSINSIAQDEWAPLGAKWFYSFTILGVDRLATITSVNDTLFQDKACKELKFEWIGLSMKPDGTYYLDTAESSEIFYYDKSHVFHFDKAGYFYKLYDFSLTAGDTVLVRDTSYAGNFSYKRFEYIVDSISTINISEDTLKMYYTSPTIECDWTYSPGIYPVMPIIEKIGSTMKFFGNSILTPAGGTSEFLRCYEDNSISYKSHIWPDWKSCDYLPQLNNRFDLKEQNESIIVYPNPFNDYLNIHFTRIGNYQIEVLNIVGELKYCSAQNFNIQEINLSVLHDGPYFLLIQKDNQILFKKLIIKN